MSKGAKEGLAGLGLLLLFFGLGSGFFRLISISDYTWGMGYDDFKSDVTICVALIASGLLCVAPYFLSRD